VHDYWIRDTPVDAPTASTLDPHPREFHRRLPGYRPTPLLPLDGFAEELGLGGVWLKYEDERFGLPAFKALGATWAVYRWLHETIPGGMDGRWRDLAELRALAAAVQPRTLVTASDGNHGHAIARVAAMFGFAARILLPAGTAASRVDAIAGEGARVEIVDGSYDEAVARAAALADDAQLVVSDTSWPGYTRIPRWIAEGYATLFAELDEQTGSREPPDVLLVPVGVGSLALAAIRHYARRGTAVVAVEPADAACVLASVRQDRPVTVPGPHRSMMVGLNCGTPSQVAWPALRGGLTAALAIDDRYAVHAMRRLARHGIPVGETGAAALGALLALTEPPSRTLREALWLGPATTVALLATEAVTDPVNYARICDQDG
jgi:diaminopropionate ammonia-lyase